MKFKHKDMRLSPGETYKWRRMQLICAVITITMAGAYLWLWQLGLDEFARWPIWVIVVNSFVVAYAHSRLGFWLWWPVKPPSDYR